MKPTQTVSVDYLHSLINEAPSEESPNRMAKQSWPRAQRFISVSLDKPTGCHVTDTPIPARGGQYKAWWSCPISPSMERQEA